MTENAHDLDATYRGYVRSGRSSRRWSPANPGNQAIHKERNAAFETALADSARDRPITRLLEVGCGEGALLDELVAMFPLRDAACVGVDLLAFRLAAGRASGGTRAMGQADGQHLPFPNECFDVVVLSTVLSSVQDDEVVTRIATECDRVLRPGGSVVWYDMRLPNPGNRRVRPMRRDHVAALFSSYGAELRSVTLLPQVARRLGRLTGLLYGVLSSLPPLRSHLVGRLVKAPGCRPEGPS